ncbi:MAG: prolyl oligopeptidase family serine peptidase [Asticcacaulis sp.]
MNILRNVVFTAVLSVCAFSAAAETNPLGAPPPLSAFGKRPDIEEVALSPDGKRLALIKGYGADRLVMDLDIEKDDFKALRVGDVKVRSLFWGDETRIILISSQTVDLRQFVGGKDEYYLGQILDIPNNKAFALYRNIDRFYTIVMGDFYRIKVKDRYRVTASNVKLEGEGLRSLYNFDLDTGRGQKMEEEPFHVRNWVVRGDGQIMARAEYDRDDKVWTLRYRQDGKWRSIYSEKQMLDAPSLIGRGRDDESVLVYINAGEKAGNYYEVFPDGRFSEPLEAKGDNVAPYFHPATRKLAGFTDYTPDGPVYTFFAPDLAQLPRLIEKGMPGYTYRRLVDASDDARKIIVYGEGPEDPGSYFFIDYTNKNFKAVGETRPEVPIEWIAQKRKVTYKAADGLEIQAFLTLPPGREAKNLPLVVVPHGGPQSYDDISYDWTSQALASRGYAVLQPNFRGSDGYGQAFVEKGYGEFGRKMQTDLSDGVRHLAAQGIIDPKRVCIAGASYGGYAALAGAAFDPGVYRCASATAPVTNLKAFIRFQETAVGYDKKATRVLYWKRFLGEPSGWDAVSPDVKAANITIPIQLIHGKDDTVVPIEQSYSMRDALKKAGNPAEVVILEGEDHWLSREPTRVQTLTAIVAFIEKHNPAY